MGHRNSMCLAATCFVLCLFPLSIPFYGQAANSPTISLSFHKRLGFWLGSDMSGAMTLSADVSADVIRVDFYMDGQTKLNDTSNPFQWEFDTTQHSLGPHLFEAIAYNGDGESAYASTTANFVESPFPPYYALFLGSVFGLLIALILIFRLIPILRRNKKREAPFEQR